MSLSLKVMQMNKLRVGVDKNRLQDGKYIKEVCDTFLDLKIIRAKMGAAVFEAILLMQYNLDMDGPITTERTTRNRPKYFFYGAKLTEILPTKTSSFTYSEDNSFFIEATHE